MKNKKKVVSLRLCAIVDRRVACNVMLIADCVSSISILAACIILPEDCPAVRLMVAVSSHRCPCTIAIAVAAADYLDTDTDSLSTDYGMGCCIGCDTDCSKLVPAAPIVAPC